ncbi:hemoblobin-interacting domain-containing protein [Anaeromicrobium sediminis]|uniref:Heme-binding protein Shr-like Hb-interacting domain-containing protein n=1 Tax=Anaeromicrobium sediminis TaxID=1478221 RepID=A0A267MIC1_9FIRM|nr:hemoblobin-interacting domain-containing protein [Anaeromicrobium sediminis]PAB58543.1 hypothetical protein CCE28_14700 [Anaeromicrobium sediminis]
MLNKGLKKGLAMTIIATQVLSSGIYAYGAPSKIYGHKPLYMWDYHKTNYDKDGNIKYTPSITQFSTSNDEQEVDVRIPELNTHDTEYGKNVEISFDDSTPEAKQWQANIYRITKIDPYTGNPDLEADINFKIEDGKITLYSDSRPIDYNDSHDLKIYSTGYDEARISVHIVSEGLLTIHPDFHPIAGMDLLLELKDFNYRVTNPIHTVLLDGKVLKGDCEEYHVVSNLVRLENDALGKLTPGQHTVTVKATGYKDMEKTFIVEENDGSYVNPVTDHNNELSMPSGSTNTSKNTSVDVLTSASTSGGSGGDSGGSGGSIIMPADVVFDFDLISNAQILQKLDMGTEKSQRVLAVWNDTIKDAVAKEGEKRVLSYSGYTNAYEDAKVQGKYLSFDEYLNSPDAEDWNDRPYNVKYILEDGQFGEAQPYGDETLEVAPTVEVEESLLGNIVKLRFNDDQWKDRISNIKVGTTTLFKSEYSIQDNEIHITPNRFTREENEIIIEAYGYKNAKVNVFVEKASMNLDIDDETKNIGEHVNIVGVDEDYVENLKSVKLNGKYLLPITASTSGWEYKTQSDKIVLNEKLFKDNTQQTVIIESYGYDTEMVQFSLEGEAEIIDPVNDIVPENMNIAGEKTGEDVIITWSNDNPKWRSSITNIKVGPYWTANIDGSKYSVEEGKITIDGSVFSEGENIIEILAENYATKELRITLIKGDEVIDPTPEEPTLPEEPEGPKNPPTFDKTYMYYGQDLELGLDEWARKLGTISINGETLTKDVDYYEDISNGKLVIKYSAFKTTGNSDIVFISEGYNNLEAKLMIRTPMEVPAEVRLSTENTKRTGDEIKVDLSGVPASIDSYEVRDVYLNDEKLTKDDDYTSSTVSVNIKGKNFHNPGSYKIVLKAGGYEDKEFNVEVTGDPIENTNEPPTLTVDTDNNYFKEDIEITINETSGWINNIYEISINGEVLNGGDLDRVKKETDKITFYGTLFDEPGNYNIEIKSTGFKTTSINQEIKKRNPELTTNLENKTVNAEEFSFDVKFVDSVSMERIEAKVKFNGSPISPTNGVIGYKVNLNERENTIDIEATDEDGLRSSESYTITYEKVEELKDVPSGVSVKDSSELKPGDDIKIELGYSWETEYKDAMKNGSVIVDGQNFTDYEIKEITEGYSTYTAAVLKGSNFDDYGTYNITLKAPGYEDKDFEVVISKKKVPSDVLLVTSEININEDVKFELGDSWGETATYKEALEQEGNIKVDEKNVSNYDIIEEGSYFKDFFLIINGEYFDEPKEYSIELEVNGYETVTESVYAKN